MARNLKHKKTELSLTWGLFELGSKHVLQNLNDIRILFKRITFLLKNGYPEQLTWECAPCFEAMFKEVLKKYRDNRTGVHVLDGNYGEDADILYQKENILIDRMLLLLDGMDETQYDDITTPEECQKAHDNIIKNKDEFFEMLKKYWPHFWD